MIRNKKNLQPLQTCSIKYLGYCTEGKNMMPFQCPKTNRKKIVENK